MHLLFPTPTHPSHRVKFPLPTSASVRLFILLMNLCVYNIEGYYFRENVGSMISQYLNYCCCFIGTKASRPTAGRRVVLC